MGIQTLAQGRAGRHILQTQCSLEECVGTEVFDGIKVVLAKTQQAQVGFEDVAIGNAGANWENRIDQGIDVDGLEILANKCQAGMRAKIVGQFFDNEVGHGKSHLLGEYHFTPKSLIYRNKFDFSHNEVTDSSKSIA